MKFLWVIACVLAALDMMLEKLATPKPGNHVSRLPTKSAQTNAALIASIMKAKEGRE